MSNDEQGQQESSAQQGANTKPAANEPAQTSEPADGDLPGAGIIYDPTIYVRGSGGRPIRPRNRKPRTPPPPTTSEQ